MANPKPTTLKNYAVAMAEKHSIAKKQANTMLEDFVGMIVKSLKKGEKIRIAGLGIFQVRKRPARMGRNPATGEAIKIKASKKVAFRAAKDLNHRAQVRAAGVQDPDFSAFLKESAPLVEEMHSTIMLPAPCSPLK